ncbi:MAG: hypothetical protein HRT35_20315 [Algicola sp.]|nr:hypothetical protein [Algicola sp.]
MNRIKNNALQATAWLLSLLMSATAYAGAPTFSATLSPTTIGPGSLSTLTYTVDNTAQSSGATDLTFSTTLPTGVTLTAAPNATTTCINGIFTATGGSNSVTFTGYRLGANASCTLTMNITSSTAGTHTIPAATLSTSAGSVSNATVDLTVDGSRPGFTIAFSPSTITPGGISTLIYTIDNSRNGSNASSLAFYDTLPSGLLIADAPNVSTTCSGTASHTFSPGTSAFTGGVSAVTSGETCTVSVDVTAAVAGSYLHVSASLLQSFTNPSGSASAELLVSTSFVNAFFPGAVKPGDSVKLTYTLTNNDRANAATGITFTNDLNTTLSGLAATALPANDFCGSGSTMTGSSNLTINGANLVSGASCTFEVTVLIPAGAAAGTYTNSTSIINLTLGSATTKPIATNTLIVVKAPVVTAEFVDDPVTAGQDVTLRYTITNSDAVNTVSKITFTENINEAIGGIVIKTRPNSNSCGTGSTFTSNDNGNGLLYFGVADANLVGGANCTFDVILTLPADATPGTWGFSTTAPSGEINGATVYGTAVSHNLVVVSAPTLFLSITETDASPGSTVNAQFTLNYSPLAAADVTGVGFTVDLENALTGLVSTTATQNDVCGSGSTFGGTSTLTLSGASMSADSTCTFSVVLQIPADAVPSTISVLSSTVTGTSGGQSVSAASASDSVVISGLSWGVAVVTDPTAAGATNILRFTINNAATGLAATALSASMDLNKALSGLKGTSIPTDPCGAGSLLAGTTYLSFSGGSLQPGESCTFDVNILVPANASSGLYNLPTLPMSATVNGNNTSTPAVTTLMNVESLTVNVATSATAPYTTSPIPVNIDFSRSVTGFTVADLTVTNGTASNFAGSGLLYTADITPTASGTVTVSVPASVADDAVFNSVTNPASNTLSFTYDASPTFPTPTIAISAPSTSLANTGPVTYTVTYTNAAEISLSGSAITLNKTQSATATVTVTTVDSLTRTINLSSITGDGTLGVSINTGTAKNGDQQAPAIGPSSTFAVDNALPTVTINGPSGHVTEKFTATFTFSEDVSGFALADITVGNGSADNFTTTSATVYTADITPSFEGDVTVTVPASVVVDAANNGNVAAASPYVIKYDKVPTVAISGAVGHVSDPFTATFTFNENVTDFTLADITLFNATKSNFVATSATSYTADITPTNEGNFTVDVPASVAIDSISNPNTAAPQLSLTYDKRPTLTIGGPTGHVSEKFTATFTFNETVTGFSLAAIVPTNGTVDNFVTLTSKSYTADITPTSEGPVYVDVSSDVAFDTVNNGNIFAPQYTITYDKIPSLVIDGPTGHVTGKYTNIFTFNETVTGFTIDDITLFNATKDNFVTLSAGVSYSVDVTPTAEGAGGVTVDVPANAVLDSIGNANLAPTQYTVVYDKVPTVAISGPSGHVNDKFTATVTFNEPVTEFILADISVTNGSADNFVATSSTVYTADISPTNEGTVTLNVAASVAIDSVSNPNLEASPYTITYDKVPTVTITGPAIPAKEKFTAVFTFNEIVTEFVLADITVGNGTADNFVVTDGKIYTADITPATEGNVTVDVAASVAIDSVSDLLPFI